MSTLPSKATCEPLLAQDSLVPIPKALELLQCGRKRLTALIFSGELRTFPRLAPRARRLPRNTKILRTSIEAALRGESA